MKVYTVVAIDEFGREFNHWYVETPYGQLRNFDEGVFYSYVMQRTINPILKEMGEAASAEWKAWSYELS